MRRIGIALLLSLIPMHSDATLVQSDDLLIGSGVDRSTVTIAPSSSTPSIALSSGIYISSGGITFGDGTARDSAAFSVNFSTRIVPNSSTPISNTNPAAIANSTISITKRFLATLVKAEYNCDLQINGQSSVYIWILRGADLISTQSQTGNVVGAIFAERHDFSAPTLSVHGELFDDIPSTGTLSYSLMNQTSSGTHYLGEKTVCVFSAEEVWK